MKISKEYGPQFDPTDGTIGDLKLVKKFLLVNGEGKLFHNRYEQHSYGDKTLAEEHCREFIANNINVNGTKHFVEGLHVEEWWCYPRHFGPVGKVSKNK